MSLPLLLFVLLHIIGGDVPNPVKMSAAEGLQFLAFATILLGLIAGWKWDGLGGAVAIGGLVLFFAINFLASGNFPSGWFIVFTPGIPALLFLTSYVMGKTDSRRVVPGNGGPNNPS